MRALREWSHRLWATLSPRRRDDDLEEELRLHLDLVAEDARRRGDDPDEAVRIARIEAGGGARAMDAMRDQRGLPWLDDMARDLGYALRTLRRNPGFTATAMLSLALGIGANTGIFSLVDQVLLRRLPVNDPERLVLLNWKGSSLPVVEMGDSNLMSYPLCRDLQEQERFFDGAFCRHPGQVNFSAGREYDVVSVELVSGSYFRVLGIRPALGRFIDASDDQHPGNHPAVVISYDYWRNRLGGAQDVVGRKVLVNRSPMTVVGVAPSGFGGMDAAEPATLWLPAMMAREATIEFSRVLNRRAFWMHGFARLKPGVTAEAATAGLQPWFKAMLDADTRREDFPRVQPEQQRAFLASTLEALPGDQGWSRLRARMAQPLWALMAGTILLLLLACLNVAGLMLARGAERGQELTTRMALGASRGRITRQLIVEALFIALAGGVVGLAVAPLVSRALLYFMPQGTNLAPVIDHRIFLFAAGATLVAGVLSGLAPAFQASRRPLAASITGRSTASGANVRFRKAIVAAQLALTLVLLAGAGLFVQTLARLYTRERGFDSSRLVMFRADPAGTGSPVSDAPRVMLALLQTLQGAPIAERVSLANNGLLGSAGPGRVLTIDSDRRIVTERPVPMLRIGADYFSTLGVKLIAGREFNERDTVDLDRTGFRSVIVNESFVRRYFGGLNPVGRRVGIGNLPDTPLNVEVVGVVGDFRRRSLHDDSEPEHMFVPFARSGAVAGDGTFFVRVRGKPAAAFAAIRKAVAEVDPALPLIGLTTVDDQVMRALRSELMLATLSTGFGGAALLLSVVGLFGVMSFVVTQRTQEIGMRMALGATRSAAIWLIVRDALVTIAAAAALGLAIALTVAFAFPDWLNTAVDGVSPSDLRTFAATTTMLAAVALAACVIPAGRAAALSPMVAIREQPESLWRAARLTVGRAMRELTAETGTSLASGTLTAAVAGAMHRADSFPDAVELALATLRDRVGARFILLLERAGAEYRSRDFAIPANGLLINRLTHYPHPLALTAGDFEAWGRWADELQPAYRAEIARLAGTDARIAVPLWSRQELAGVLLLGAPAGREAFTADEKGLLSAAADVFALLIENVGLNARALQQEKLRRDLALAAEVQRRLLPAEPPRCETATLAAFTLPARTVGGDYYDFLELPGERMAIAVADIAGKGIPAALLMSALQASLRVLAAEHDLSPSQLAARMSGFLHESTAGNSYATFFYAQLDVRRRRLQYVNAGHNPPYLVRRIGTGVEIAELTEGGTVLGLFPHVEYQDGHVDLCPGDLLVAFTDGVTEARNEAGEEFGDERLQDLLREVAGSPAETVSSILSDRVRQWIGAAEQHDDVTFVIAAVN
ncbi:MAG TPA: ADOP family duplicated permease [Vicinamibacterales bacterium]|nr:ADOP family duplicated permease [Vicinamibacterales bacterium]